MTNLDKYFKGQQKHEELVCFFRQHWIVLMREFLIIGLFMVVLILTIFNISEIATFLKNTPSMETIFVIGFVASTVYIHYFFLKFLNHFVRVGIITDIRLIDHKKTLYFVDTLETTDLNNIQDMEQVSEGLLPNILGYGDLKIYLTASSTIKTFSKVPNAQFHFRCISRQKEERQKIMRNREPSGLNYPVDSRNNVTEKNEDPVYYNT